MSLFRTKWRTIKENFKKKLGHCQQFFSKNTIEIPKKQLILLRLIVNEVHNI